MSRFIPRGMGWWPDLPDLRDFTPEDETHAALFAAHLPPASKPARRLPAAIDLRRDLDGDFAWPIEDQDTAHSSSAFAVLGLVEYLERRATGRMIEGSKLYLHQMARKLLQHRADTGANLRTTLRALVRYGVPPQSMWPYERARFEVDPSDLSLMGFSREFEQLRYLRLDARHKAGSAVLTTVKAFLAAGFPVAFGFSVPDSLSRDADVPFRPTFDAVRGGQAAIAIGYDNGRLNATVGALLIRCSWGEAWGEAGYGWLPYAFVEQRLAVDFWTIVKPAWLESGEFRNPLLFLGQPGLAAPHAHRNRPGAAS